jgi:hypothetical protein
VTRLLTVLAAVACVLLCAAGLAAYATTHAVLYADGAYDYGDPDA